MRPSFKSREQTATVRRNFWSVRDSTNAALGVVGHHFVVRIGDAVGKGSAGLECFFNPTAEFGGIPGILVVTRIALEIVDPKIPLQPWWEESPIRTGGQSDGKQAIGQAVASLLERGLDFPVHITTAVRTTSNEHDRDGGKADVFLPDSPHHVVRIGAFYEVVPIRHADMPRDEHTIEVLQKLLGFQFVKVAV